MHCVAATRALVKSARPYAAGSVIASKWGKSTVKRKRPGQEMVTLRGHREGQTPHQPESVTSTKTKKV